MQTIIITPAKKKSINIEEVIANLKAAKVNFFRRWKVAKAMDTLNTIEEGWKHSWQNKLTGEVISLEMTHEGLVYKETK